MAVILVFLAAIALLFIEAMAPGFGVAGIGGLVLIIVSVVMASNTTGGAVISLTVAFFDVDYCADPHSKICAQKQLFRSADSWNQDDVGFRLYQYRKKGGIDWKRRCRDKLFTSIRDDRDRRRASRCCI